MVQLVAACFLFLLLVFDQDIRDVLTHDLVDFDQLSLQDSFLSLEPLGIILFEKHNIQVPCYIEYFKGDISSPHHLSLNTFEVCESLIAEDLLGTDGSNHDGVNSK